MVNLKVIWLVVTFLSPSCCQQNGSLIPFSEVSQNRSSNPAGEPKTFRLSIIETTLEVPGPTGDLPFVVTTTQTTNATVTTANMSTTAPIPDTTAKVTFMFYEVRGLNFTMDIEYQDSFNDYSNDVYKDVYNTIISNCRKHFNDCFVRELIFTAGSTIVEYWIGSYVMDDLKLPNIETDVNIDMSSKYPIIFYSNQQLQGTSVGDLFPGRRVTITCGPPPPDLKFGSDLKADWKLDGAVISNTAQYTISTKGEFSYLTASFNKAAEVTSECRLKNGNKIFRQRGTFTVKETPLINVIMTPAQTLVRCGNIKTLTFQCTVQSPYTVMFVDPGSTAGSSTTLTYSVPGSCPNGEIKIFTCQSQTNPTFQKYIKVEFTENALKCKSDTFGDGYPGFIAKADCGEGKIGEITAECLASGLYGNIQDNCVLKEVQELFLQSEELTSTLLPTFVKKLGEVTVSSSSKVTQSPATIVKIVNILENVATSANVSVNETSMKDVLLTADVLTRKDASSSWNTINNNNVSLNETSKEPKKSSSLLLESLETITKALQEDSLTITTPLILLNKTTFTDTFNGNFNSSVIVDIPKHEGGKKSLTVITFSSMDTVLLPRSKDNSSTDVLNGKIVLIQSSELVNNISITFNTSNDTLGNPKCVFWNFRLFDGLGGWDDEGCLFVNQKTGTVSCNCNHLTSFSILMSPSAPNIPALTYITYCGLAISMISLIICLIIEAIVWGEIRNHSTSFLRHVSSINIALSLLIADIWFIIGAGKLESQSACLAVTFFIHFFYLAMFFWMLAAALLLFSRTILVLSQGLSDRTMVGIGFTLGYGAPLIIAAITIGVTVPSKNYIQEKDVCWLRWKESRTLLAFVIPALAIVLINLVILVTVLFQILRSRLRVNAAQADEKHILLVIAKSVAVLTPLFGLTWGLGVGTMLDPNNKGLHIAFAFFNSLQGFFILVFGTLLDKKVLSIIKISPTISTTTRTTNTNSDNPLDDMTNQNTEREPDSNLKPDDQVFILNLTDTSKPRWEGPFTVMTTTSTTVKINERNDWISKSYCKRMTLV